MPPHCIIPNVQLPGPDLQAVLRDDDRGVLVVVLSPEPHQLQVAHYVFEQHVVDVNHLAQLSGATKFNLKKYDLHRSHNFLVLI